MRNLVRDLIRSSILALALLMAAQSAGAQTALAEVRPVTASPVLDHARRVERRASGTSFKALETFGRLAEQRNDEEGLSRLQHVTWIMTNQDDYDAASLWNAALLRSAEKQNNARYIAVARIGGLQIRHFRDGDVTIPDIEALAAAQTDWLPKAFGNTVLARLLIDEGRIADAMRLLAQVVPMIPKNQANVASISASVWSTVSIAHMMVDDVPGYLSAINKSEAYIAASDYPRPDYESLYNLAQSLGFLGLHQEAQALVDAYARLANGTNTPTSRGFSGSLCAYAAVAREDWPGVLKCVAPFGRSLDTPESAANVMLPIRAAAYARTGQVDLAKLDMIEINRRIEQERMSESGSVRRAKAELMIAEGDYANGIPALRDYHLRRFNRASKSAAAAMEQIVVNIDDQLQAATAQNDLKAKVISGQRWLVGILIVLGVGAIAMFWKQQQLTRQLAAASRRAQDAHEAKSAFFANMSHEIRTPLNGVVAMADALGRKSLDDEAGHMVRIIASSGSTLERLLSDILDEAKMDAGQIEIEAIPFNLGETVGDVQSLWGQAAEKKGVTLKTNIDAAVQRWAIGDRVRLSQVLNNLTSNALKFTTEGGVTLTAAAVGKDRVRFTVSDTGVGFDAAQKLKIFERFQQADGTISRRFGGTGLGLSICRQLVGLMGGELDCDSTPGEGSRFWFEIELPYAQANSVPEEEPAAAETSEQALKVLIADDHAANRTILGMLLDSEGMDLRFAEDGQQAVDAVRNTVFDVILMDMQMPVMGGLDATRAIRELEATEGRNPTTIVILSANVGTDDQKRGREAGADGHVGKPVVLERLLTGIDLAMKRNQAA